VLAAIVLGVIFGGIARLSVRPQVILVIPEDAIDPLAIRVVGRDEAFPDLDSAIESAPDQGIIVVPRNVQLRPSWIRGKRLTIQAAEGTSPVLERAKSNEREWEAMLSSNQDLVLQGLTLRGSKDDLSSLVYVEKGSLHLQSCQVSMPARTPGIVLCEAGKLTIENSTLHAEVQALAVEATGQTCRIHVRDSQFRIRQRLGALALLWGREGATAYPVEVQLHRCKVECGRILACRSLHAPVHVTGRGNELEVRESRVSYAGYPDCTQQDYVVWDEDSSMTR
jgi:hypothetical protein